MTDLLLRLRQFSCIPAGGVESMQQSAMREAADEIERMRVIEVGVHKLLEAVDKTPDHTEWFKPLGYLYGICGSESRADQHDGG